MQISAIDLAFTILEINAFLVVSQQNRMIS